MSAPAGQSWGRYPRVNQRIVPVFDRDVPLPLPVDGGSVLPHGNGRSYGDSCLNPDATLLSSRGLDRFIDFDPATGIVRCESGVTLASILDIALPRGWFLPVTPGTRYATVGGAIGNDVHGKNHHRAGTFCHHVLRLELLRSDGSRQQLTAADSSGLFAATAGGLGLTGFITWAELQLRRVPGPWIETESIRFGNLDEFFELSRDSAAGYEYTVAWIDCLAKGRNVGRGHFLRGDHAPRRRSSGHAQFSPTTQHAVGPPGLVGQRTYSTSIQHAVLLAAARASRTPCIALPELFLSIGRHQPLEPHVRTARLPTAPVRVAACARSRCNSSLAG